MLEAHDQLIRSEAEIPQEADLHAIISKERSSWLDRSVEPRQQEENDDPRRGEMLLQWYVLSPAEMLRMQRGNHAPASPLHNTHSTQMIGNRSLEIYRNSPSETDLTLMTCGIGHPDRVLVRRYHLNSLH